MADDRAVVAEDLRVTFGATRALDGVTFAVPRGSGRTARARPPPSAC